MTVDSKRYDLFIRPFSAYIWMAFGVTAVTIAALFLLISAGTGTKGSRKPYKVTKIGRSLWKMVMALVEKGSDDFYLVGGPEKPLIFCWAVFLLIMQAAYSSALITHFIDTPMAPFKSLEELASLLETGNLHFISQSNSSRFLTDVRSSDQDTYTRIRQAFQVYPPMIEPDINILWGNITLHRQYVTDENSFTVNILAQDGCKVAIHTSVLRGNNWFSFLLPKGSPYRTELSEAIVNAQGMIMKIQEKYKRSKCPTALSNRDLKLTNVLGVTVLLILGCFCGLLSLLVETGLHYFIQLSYFGIFPKRAYFNPKTTDVTNPKRRHHLRLRIECMQCGEIVKKVEDFDVKQDLKDLTTGNQSTNATCGHVCKNNNLDIREIPQFTKPPAEFWLPVTTYKP